MAHKCEKCKYYYRYKGKESETVYSPLTDQYITLTADKQLHACGYEPGGVILDKEAPMCRNYAKELDK